MHIAKDKGRGWAGLSASPPSHTGDKMTITFQLRKAIERGLNENKTRFWGKTYKKIIEKYGRTKR